MSTSLIEAARKVLPLLQVSKEPDAIEVRDRLVAAILEHERASEKPGDVTNRLLGLADQFMEDWEETVRDDNEDDSDVVERRIEWDLWRPRIVKCVEFTYRTATIPAHIANTPDTAAKLRTFAKEALK